MVGIRSFKFAQFSLNDKLACLIIFFIGFQQFPVIRVGGSFKLYELFAIILLVLFAAKVRKYHRTSIVNVLAFSFFIVSPIISLVSSYLVLDYPFDFYRNYIGVDTFKFNYYVFPVLQMVYMFFNYAAFSAIINSKKIYESINAIFRISIYIGTGIALYSLFAMFIFDPITQLPSVIQNKQSYFLRSVGFSQEPSFYVLYQTWVVLIAFYSKQLFRKQVWLLLFTINCISLVLTFSTTLVSLVLIIAISVFIFKNSIKTRITLILSFLLCCGILAFVLNTGSNWDYFESYFINKITNFFSAPDHTLDSGGFRSYTTRIGLEIFKDNPIAGVGVGNSIYYMHLYENKMGITVFGERLFAGSFPQNAFSIVLSEQGFIGGLLLVFFLIKIGLMFWRYRNFDQYCKMFLIGYLFTLSCMITIAPIYSLFLWVFLALGIGYIYHFHSKKYLIKRVPD